jgi:hypothetical protein
MTVHGASFTTGAWKVDKNPKYRKLLKQLKKPVRVIAAKKLRNVASGKKFAAITDYNNREILYNQDMKMTLKEKQRIIAHEIGHFKLREKGIKAQKRVPLSKQALEELKKTSMYKHIRKEGYSSKKIPEEAFATYYENLKGPDRTPEKLKKFKKKFPILQKEFSKLANGKEQQ